jgi:hypothetical protein
LLVTIVAVAPKSSSIEKRTSSSSIEKSQGLAVANQK